MPPEADAGNSFNSRSGCRYRTSLGYITRVSAVGLRSSNSTRLDIGDRFVFFDQKHEYGIARRDFVSMFQPVLFDDFAVDEGAVPAFQILDLKPAVVASKQAMLPGNRGIDDRYYVRGVAPDGSLAIRQRNGGIFRGSRNHQ